MKAYCLLRKQPWYRHDAFCAGLRECGYHVFSTHPDKIDRDTVLLIWNRYAEMHELALRVEAGGGQVLVAENGYIGAQGTSPKFDIYNNVGDEAGHYFALSKSYHNGGGEWPNYPDRTERWERMGLKIEPWRETGDHVLVCPNRSFGVPGRMQPPDWEIQIVEQLKKQTKRPIKLRKHPGNNSPKIPLEVDLENAWAVVVWYSTAGVHALLKGIPVFCAAPYWIMKGAAASGTIDEPVTPDRLPHFERLAWGQWTTEEVARGEPFRHLLSKQ